MSLATGKKPLFRYLMIVLSGAALGAFLGYASAQETASGWLDTDCAGKCAANGYDAEFCGQVCWIPDPAKSAEGDNLDWKCMTGCRERGGGTRACMASCRRY
jgi:hypothetical protein